jgi:hypothetical protein
MNMKVISGFKLFSLAVVVLFCSCNRTVTDNIDGSGGQNYYVSNRGDDTNDGSIKSPWASLNRVNEQALAPGDSILFERGSHFEGAVTVTASGTERQPITFAAYGVGSAPALTNQKLSTQNGNIIQIRGSYIVIDGLYFYNGMAADQDQGVNARQIGAVYLTEGANHNVIKNCEMVDCPIGIQSYGQYNLLTANHIHDCNRFLEIPNWGPIGIMVATSNHEISYNHIENYLVDGGTFGADGGAIELDNEEFPNKNVNIHHNWSIGNEGFVEVVWGEDITTDVRIHHNVSDDYQEFIFFWSGKNCYVEHNTVLCTRPQNSRVKVVFSFNEGNNTIRNNIFVVAGGVQVLTGENVYGAEKYDEQIYSNNLYWCVDGSVDDPIGLPPGDGDIVADPGFVDLESMDLHLTAGSAAIDAGTDIGYEIDFDGNARISGDAPDIGAFEFIN